MENQNKTHKTGQDEDIWDPCGGLVGVNGKVVVVRYAGEQITRIIHGVYVMVWKAPAMIFEAKHEFRSLLHAKPARRISSIAPSGGLWGGALAGPTGKGDNTPWPSSWVQRPLASTACKIWLPPAARAAHAQWAVARQREMVGATLRMALLAHKPGP